MRISIPLKIIVTAPKFIATFSPDADLYINALRADALFLIALRIFIIGISFSRIRSHVISMICRHDTAIIYPEGHHFSFILMSVI